MSTPARGRRLLPFVPHIMSDNCLVCSAPPSATLEIQGGAPTVPIPGRWQARNKISAGIKELVTLPAGSAFRVLKWENNLREVQWVVSSGERRRIYGEGHNWHYHQALELAYFTSGSGTLFAGDRIQGFSGGEIILLGENLPHYWHTAAPCAGISVQFYFAPANPIWAFPESGALATHLAAARRGIKYRDKTAEALMNWMPELAKVDGLERMALFLQILARAAQAPVNEWGYISTQTFSLESQSGQQNAIRAAIRFLLTHYREDIKLAQLLEVTRMSKPTFSRHFKRHSGKPLNKFLQQIRVEAACRELVQTGKPVIEIALATGFSQVSFFNRVFQEVMKCTPSAYRERKRKCAPLSAV